MAKGRGKGKGGLSRQLQAAPIAVQSRDYARNLKNREYGGDAKEERAELRRKEIEERQLAREQELPVDLGRDNEYWKRCADSASVSSRKAAAFVPTPAAGGHVGTARSRSMPAVYQSSTVGKSPSTHSLRSADSNGWGKVASNGISAPAARAGGSEQSKGGGSQCKSDPAVWPSLRPAVDLVFAGQGWTDVHVPQLIRRIQSQLDGRGIARDLDLSNNGLSDSGLADVLVWLTNTSVACHRLRIDGNPLREPMSVAEFLCNSTVGLKSGGERRLVLRTAGMTQECLWRICEAAYRWRPRPPFVLCLADGEVGPLGEVANVAAEYGLLLEGIDPKTGKLVRLPRKPLQDFDVDVVVMDLASGLLNEDIPG